MAYTLRGRIESRLAATLVPLLAACALALALRDWWPVELAGLMLGIGLALDAALYHRLLRYQPGWAAIPLGLLELAAVMGLSRLLDVAAPLGGALAFYGGAWLFSQVLGHAVLPLARLEYAEDGGELGRPGAVVGTATVAVVAAAASVGWATQPPTVRLDSGVHEGPIVVDEAQTLVGETGAVVKGGLVVAADDVTVRNVTVVGGELGIAVENAERVVLDDVHVLDAELDGINVRRSQVTISDCSVASLRSPYGQGIDVSFAADLGPSVIEGCSLSGGQEGIFVGSAHAHVEGNRVWDTTLRAITITEMSMAAVEENEIVNALGIGIFCSDYSMCDIRRNSIAGIRADHTASDSMREGYGIVSHYWSHSALEDNVVSGSPHEYGSFADADIEIE